MNESFKPFFDWLLKFIDKPLSYIGMSKTEFFSLLMVLLSIVVALPMKGRAAEIQAWIIENKGIIQTALLGGIGFGISGRMFKIQQQIADNPETAQTTPTKYF